LHNSSKAQSFFWYNADSCKIESWGDSRI